MSDMEATDGRRRRGAIPGEPGLWLFLLADLTVFAVFFAAVIVMRADDPALFTRGSAGLGQGLATAGTLLLLTSSLLVVLAGAAARRGGDGPATGTRLLEGALVCGAGFVAVKSVGWAQTIQHGGAISSNDFLSVYFMLTGIHMLHVLVGIVVLVALRRELRREAPPRLAFVDGGSCYWHMVDLLWLILFPLLYLLP